MAWCYCWICFRVFYILKWLENYSWNFYIQSRILYWIIVLYLSFIYVLLMKPIYPDNQVIKIVVDLWSKFLSGH